MKIKGKTAIITGASRGVGKAVALKLAKYGVNLALVARERDKLKEVAGQAEKLGVKVLVVPCDITDSNQIKSVVQTVIQELGQVHILVNSAGFGVWKPFLEISDQEHQKMMETNYWGTYNFIRAILPSMLANKKGHIVNISSGTGKFALSVTSGYSASKFAVTGLSEALYRELRFTGVKVSCLHPGSIKTEFWNEQNTPKKYLPATIRLSPKISPEKVARAVCYCLWLGFSAYTFPVFVAILAKLNALWLRLGDIIMWKYFYPALAILIFILILIRVL